MAWQLASELDAHLSYVQRTSVYLKLGCGDSFDAIAQMLDLARLGQLALTPQCTSRLAVWLAGYVGTTAEHEIRGLLDRARDRFVQ